MRVATLGRFRRIRQHDGQFVSAFGRGFAGRVDLRHYIRHFQDRIDLRLPTPAERGSSIQGDSVSAQLVSQLHCKVLYMGRRAASARVISSSERSCTRAELKKAV